MPDTILVADVGIDFRHLNAQHAVQHLQRGAAGTTENDRSTAFPVTPMTALNSYFGVIVSFSVKPARVGVQPGIVSKTLRVAVITGLT